MEKILQKILDAIQYLFGGGNVRFYYFNGETQAIQATITEGKKFRLMRVELHLDEAPSDSENFTITLDAIRGDIFDAVYFTRNLSVGSVTDLIISFDESYVFDKDDVINVAYANTGKDVWGVRVVTKLLEG